MNDIQHPSTINTPMHAPIKVIGVGGGGSNAVNTMFNRGITGVDFIVCNTDAQALDASPVEVKVQLGATLTGGQGAGSLPEVGRNAAIETLDEVKELIGAKTSMVFITAGMGGGTGTGAAPIIAQAAREMDILTVGIVTIPFEFEGRRRTEQANAGLAQMRDAVDTLLIIRNDKLRELYGNLTIRKAFTNADEILCTAAKGIAEVITLTGDINVDMNDVNTVMRNSGRAIMGSGMASGEGRASQAVTEALESPLLNDCDITGANFVLLNITFGTEEILMDEIMEITDFIQEAAGQSAEVIWGYGVDENLDADLCVTVIATGFKGQDDYGQIRTATPKKFMLNDHEREIVSPIEPISHTEPVPTADEEAPFLLNRSEKEPVTWNLDGIPSDLGNSLGEKTTEPSTMNLGEEDVVDETAPEVAPMEGNDEPEITVYTLDSEPLPTTSDKPDLEGINFHESAKPTPTPEPTPPLSSTGIRQRTGETAKTPEPTPTISNQDTQKSSGNRAARIMQFTRKLKTPGGLADLEAEPAYKRRQVVLDDLDHSSTSQVSRFSLNEQVDEEGDRHIELRNNNPFLHDNVD
ncbi:MAG: cell division protein FtsZ [Flavobacteriales bacterium]|nr:cell division protein FtsZ [Flavobacteriales bacterium]